MSLDIKVQLEPAPGGLSLLSDERVLLLTEEITSRLPSAACGWSLDPADTYVSVMCQFPSAEMALLLVVMSFYVQGFFDQEIAAVSVRYLRGADDPLNMDDD